MAMASLGLPPTSSAPLQPDTRTAGAITSRSARCTAPETSRRVAMWRQAQHSAAGYPARVVHVADDGASRDQTRASSARWTIRAGYLLGAPTPRRRVAPPASVGAEHIIGERWQPETELGAPVVPAIGRPDSPAHRLDELAADEQADPGT